MIRLTRKNYQEKIGKSKLSNFAKEKLVEAITAFFKSLIPPMVSSQKEFEALKSEIGPLAIDGQNYELTAQPMDDNASFRVRITSLGKPLQDVLDKLKTEKCSFCNGTGAGGRCKHCRGTGLKANAPVRVPEPV